MKGDGDVSTSGGTKAGSTPRASAPNITAGGIGRSPVILTDLVVEHRTLRGLTLARDAGAAIEALTYHINRAPSQLIAYAQRLGHLTAPPSRPPLMGFRQSDGRWPKPWPADDGRACPRGEPHADAVEDVSRPALPIEHLSIGEVE
jgi:hypothetical protein